MVLYKRVEEVVRERKGKETVADYEKVNTDETGEKRNEQTGLGKGYYPKL